MGYAAHMGIRDGMMQPPFLLNSGLPDFLNGMRHRDG
jgi:hypothetical protein